ncbi:MAG: hypothetical protein HFE90_04870 [Firmicutes bacterium]|nr:hypothetical protein [Bacillota bacterium]
MAINKKENFKFSIVRHFGVLSTSSTGWTKELNMVEWNDTPAKYDLRDWRPDHEKMGRGITLSKNEMKELVELIDSGRVSDMYSNDFTEEFNAMEETGSGSGLYDDLTA